MKRASSILLAVALVLYCFTSCRFSTYAASSNNLGSVTVDDVLNFFKVTDPNKSGSLEKRTEAARAFFFYFMCHDGFGFHSDYPASDFFNSDGSFSDEFLKFYYERYCSVSSASQVTGDVFLEAAGFDCDFKFEMISFMPTNFFTKGWDFIFKNYFNDFKNYYNSFLSRFLVYMDSSSVVEDPAPDKSGLDIAPGYVSGTDFNDYIISENSKFYPKNTSKYISYRNDTIFAEQLKKYPSLSYSNVMLYDDFKFFLSGGNDLYFVIFEDWYGTTYYSQHQFHLSFDGAGDTRNLKIEYWDMTSGSQDKSSVISVENVLKTGFFYFPLIYSTFGNSYPSLEKYYIGSDLKSIQFTLPANFNKLISSDLSVTRFTHNSYDHFSGVHLTADCNCNVGMIGGAIPIKMSCDDIDTTKIPDNYYITINGDTIYDYSITNPETGQTSTVNEYVTNNYTYITEATDSGSEVVGGDVVVGGQIDVNGSVDVNVNVNNGPSSYPDTDLVDNLPEAPKEFTDYLAVLFDFLPIEILALIIAGIAAAIFCRIWGR